LKDNLGEPASGNYQTLTHFVIIFVLIILLSNRDHD